MAIYKNNNGAELFANVGGGGGGSAVELELLQRVYRLTDGELSGATIYANYFVYGNITKAAFRIMASSSSATTLNANFEYRLFTESDTKKMQPAAWDYAPIAKAYIGANGAAGNTVSACDVPILLKFNGESGTYTYTWYMNLDSQITIPAWQFLFLNAIYPNRAVL